MKKTFTQIGLNLVAKLSLITTIVWMMSVGFIQAQCSISGVGSINGNVNYGDPINWANPNRVTLSDDLYARAKLNPDDTTKYLMVADFGFVLNPGAVIQGIEVKVEVKEDFDCNAADASIRLMKGGVATGSDYAGTGIYETKDTTNFYGGAYDLWGTTWTPTDINSAGFGVLFSVTRSGGPVDLYVYVDLIEVTVYYTGGSCILPIELSAFNAQRTESDDVELTWASASQAFSSDFSIERSLDGSNFSSIGMVSQTGAGSYTFTDSQASKSRSFYRLMQIDQNGSLQYSQVVEVSPVQGNGLQMTFWPNPATDQLHIVAEAKDAKMSLLDLGGKVVMERQLGDLSTGGTTIDLSSQAKGMYLLRLQDGSKVSTEKLVLR
jgi:hypothetical protein